MRRKIQFLLFLFLCLVSIPLTAQNIEVKGIVTEATTNDPLPGVTVKVKGKDTGTITSIDGMGLKAVPPQRRAGVFGKWVLHFALLFPLLGSPDKGAGRAKARPERLYFGSKRLQLFAVCCRQLFEGGQAPLDFLGVDAVGKAHIALDTKRIAGHQQQVKLPGFHAERVGVFF